MNQPSLLALRSRARQLAALATDVSTTENERSNSATALLRLLKENPDIIPDTPERTSEDDDGGEPLGVDKDITDVLISGIGKLFTSVDMRAKCVECNEPAGNLRYGKCRKCLGLR